MSDHQAEPGLLVQLYADMLPTMDPETLREHRREVEQMAAAGDEYAASKAIIGGIVAAIRCESDD